MRATDFVQSYFEAWNHRDPVAVADHLASNGTYCDVPENRHRSHDELIVSLEAFFSAYRHRYELVGDILEGPNTIAFQYRMCPLVQARKQATPGLINGAEFITLHGDTAMTIFDHYDVPGIEQTGAVTQLSTRNRKNGKYAKSGLSEEQLASYKCALEHVMNIEQAYLRADLTLPTLAKLVACSVNHLSQVINAGFGVSFFDYLNAYRVEHARELLAGLDSTGTVILNIAFAVGFNSNSAFYAAFKKHVGQTPAQYRRTQSYENSLNRP